MAWSKSLDSWPKEFFSLAELVHTTQKAVGVTFKDIKTAKYQRLRWYGFFTAIRHNQHPLISIIPELSIIVEKDSCVLFIMPKQEHLRRSELIHENVYKKAVEALEVISVEANTIKITPTVSPT